ncbi:MAG TPA: phytanoyl-CoA dioxygenase family protein [Candidatus Latescibacteria bacterium]|jgi:ectoine hydroxylase-related dioxygenase (phytanoyl-CoA dioxygenase family)|nr:mitomycin antibiotic biosynthesis protein [Gemmatimonadota bacterium]MDP7363089.1 phytanoyl-CoA dioxygenase family protein [Candidatus Latescibacterota bacterium]MDP7632928.1 phytanoyl-CoA dioxygenase family protein [Candidatus Latescibacterota bacterium]HCV26433.1 phytanoyl-CoA dioxygenase family protein [Candidatus Latescibacterota bacterium]HJN31126.1 phytanoyl-CoA dioxygenase family protein [Candidatus Latescibacterota bacterium]|tara:strand:+ start:84 stop:932 length:849 start_codon:yes stop_codon:yes gene_type:complete
MLTDEQVRAFREDGFTVCEDFLSQTEVDALLQEADGAIEGNTLATHDAERMEMEPEQPPDGGAVRRLYEPCTYYPVSRALSEMDKLLDSVQQLFGPNLLFHYSKLNMKPAKVGSVVEWHQDLSYYPMTNRDSLAVLFYLDDTDATNGALKLIPKRHEAPLMQHTREGFFQGRVTEPVDESDVVMAEGQAGTAIFMHGLTPHASAPNTSGKPRRTLILAYRAADAIPLFLGPMTATHETHVRLVRGEPASQARFDGTAVALPRYKDAVSSLYDLQKKSREGKT